MSAGDWQSIEQDARAQARLCAQNARERAEDGSSVGAREWSEAEHAALRSSSVAQAARLALEAAERERVRA